MFASALWACCVGTCNQLASYLCQSICFDHVVNVYEINRLALHRELIEARERQYFRLLWSQPRLLKAAVVSAWSTLQSASWGRK